MHVGCIVVVSFSVAPAPHPAASAACRLLEIFLLACCLAERRMTPGFGATLDVRFAQDSLVEQAGFEPPSMFCY
jgi:hypothetical protein